MRFSRLGGIFLIGVVCLSNCKKTSPAPSVSRTPNLSLKKLGATSEWQLAPLLGKKTVLLAFFTTWCPYCNHSMPYLQQFYEKNQGRDLEVVGIDIDEPDAKVLPFAQKYGLTFPVLLTNADDQYSRHYPVRYLPTLYLIGKDGALIKKFEGFHPTIFDEIEAALKNK